MTRGLVPTLRYPNSGSESAQTDQGAPLIKSSRAESTATAQGAIKPFKPGRAEDSPATRAPSHLDSKRGVSSTKQPAAKNPHQFYKDESTAKKHTTATKNTDSNSAGKARALKP